MVSFVRNSSDRVFPTLALCLSERVYVLTTQHTGMSERNIIKEIEARLEYIPRWKIILAVILLIPPVTVLGMGLFIYFLYQGGKRLREDETGTSSVVDSESEH